MATINVTEKVTVGSLKHDAHVLITQTENVGGVEKHVLRRIPFGKFAALLGSDLDWDQEDGTLFLLNPDGSRIGVGTRTRVANAL